MLSRVVFRALQVLSGRPRGGGILPDILPDGNPSVDELPKGAGGKAR